MVDVYFAGPLFCDAEREFNARVCGMIEDEGYTTFLPQRDTGDIGELDVAESDEMQTDEDVMQYIYEADRDAVLEADLVTTVLDGRVPSEGTVIEAAIAQEHDIPVVGLKTDRRVFAAGEPYNAMVWGVIDELVDSPEDLVDAVTDRLDS